MQGRTFAALEDDGWFLAMNDAGEVFRRSQFRLKTRIIIPQSAIRNPQSAIRNPQWLSSSPDDRPLVLPVVNVTYALTTPCARCYTCLY